MKLKIGKLEFDVRPLGTSPRPFNYRGTALKETEDQQIYFWRCGSPGQGRLLPPARKPGLVPLLNQVSFARSSGLSFKYDGRETRKAQRAFLAATGLPNLASLLSRINRLLRQPIIKLPLDGYDWMKPSVTFVVNLRTEYAVFRAIDPAGSVWFDILIPHRAIFSAEVIDYCDAAAFERLDLQPETPSPDAPVEVLLPAGNDRNREWRCAAIDRELDRLADNTLYLPLHGETSRKRRKLKEERKVLCGE